MSVKLRSILVIFVSFCGLCYSKVNFAQKSYYCLDGACQLNEAGVVGLAHGICLTTCGKGNVWPLPNGQNSISSDFTKVNFANLEFAGFDDKDSKLFQGMKDNFLNSIKAIKQPSSDVVSQSSSKLSVQIVIDNKTVLIPSTQNDESYTLTVSTTSDQITVTIHGVTIFGVRHGLETLSQLISFDYFGRSLVIPSAVEIADKPQFPYRGVMIDVSRNFISIEKLKENIRAMG